MHGCMDVCVCMVLYGFVWFCLALYGFILYCNVMYVLCIFTHTHVQSDLHTIHITCIIGITCITAPSFTWPEVLKHVETSPNSGPNTLYCQLRILLGSWNQGCCVFGSHPWKYMNNMGVPQNGWFIWEILLNIDDFGYPYFRKPPYAFSYFKTLALTSK